MDSANYVTLMLLDKSYYDYDYERPPRKVENVAPKSKEETLKQLARFGVGVAARKESADELQRMAMEAGGEPPTTGIN